jgi:deoxyribodipyrimidine photolyase-related protein
MAEVAEESTHVWSHKARVALFLAAMRHFRDGLLARGLTVHYRRLDDPGNNGTLHAELLDACRRLRPIRLVVVEPGDYRVREALTAAAAAAGVPLEIRTDRHFLTTLDEFAAFAGSRRQLRLEHFYRQARRNHRVLMDGDEPAGGRWNFDHDNRGSFGKSGPGLVPCPTSFPPDETTKEVLELVETSFASHPGRLDRFDWPVTPGQATAALDDFVANRLGDFGPYQDAMWVGQPYLYHSRLSAAMNLKLLDPRDVLAAAERAYRDGRAPLAAVEGFVRQVLGWREYVRGVYWRFMPGYARSNALGAAHPLPNFYWTGDTPMNCLRECLTQTLDYGYAHHIQRLMVTGLYALLFGVDPFAVHEWYLAVYVDAVEWVELPNTVGMSQFADGGVMASKPYCASGKYIQRMSNYCAGCRYDPARSTGEGACPFTTLYWDFLLRHEESLSGNPRMAMQVRNLVRLGAGERDAIREQARRHRLEVLT